MKPFENLTPRGQTRRLRRLALEALRHYDITVRDVRLLSRAYNTIFRVETDRGRFVLRINRPHERSRAEILSELAWIEALRRETSVPVPTPFPTRHGTFVVEATAPGVPEPRLCVLFAWLPGRLLAKHLSTRTFTQLGETMAHLHRHAATWTPPPAFTLRRMDSPFPFNDPIVLFEPHHLEEAPPHAETLFRRAHALVQATISRLWQTELDAIRVLHGDLHPWNVKVWRKQLLIFDFDDAMWGHPAQDIAITFFYIFDRDDFTHLAHAFRTGYERLLPWPFHDERDMWSLLMGRTLDLLNFVLYHEPGSHATYLLRSVKRLERAFACLEAAPNRNHLEV